MKYIFFFLGFISLYSCSSEDKTASTPIPLNFTDLFTFQVDTLDLDMKSNVGQNSLYISYSTNNGFNENIMKFELNNSSQIVIVHPDMTESRQIEIVGGQLFSFGGYTNYSMDLNLQNIALINQTPAGFGYFRTLVYNNEIYFPYGFDNYTVYNTSTNNFQYFWNSFSTLRGNSDGEIINGKLYSFGGSTGTSNYQPQSYNEINIYDLVTNTWTQNTLPYAVFESFTSIYGGNIIVAGNKNSDRSGAFLAIYNPVSNTFNQLTTSLNINNITIRNVAILNNDLYIAYADIISPMPNLINIKVAKASLL